MARRVIPQAATILSLRKGTLGSNQLHSLNRLVRRVCPWQEGKKASPNSAPVYETTPHGIGFQSCGASQSLRQDPLGCAGAAASFDTLFLCYLESIPSVLGPARPRAPRGAAGVLFCCLLSCKPQAVQFIHFKCTIQWL
jgi:hypothetical protein